MQDVYEWREGSLALISSGNASADTELIGAGRDGNDVLFATYQRLVGWDTDTNWDIYDARVGGGFPEPPPEPTPCDLDGGSCEGASSTAAEAPGAGSAARFGAGETGQLREHGTVAIFFGG